MNANTEYFFLSTTFGSLECAVDLPKMSFDGNDNTQGIALIAHPQPLYGGTMDNKVVYTLARAFLDCKYVSFRMNFRGVGRSSGEHDNGNGETEDMLLLYKYARKRFPNLPLALAGFSFGAFVQAHLQQKLSADNVAISKLVLVGTPTLERDIPMVPSNSILIHGEKDEVIPLSNVFAWLKETPLPPTVMVLPNCGHFFHQRLVQLRELVIQNIK